MPKKNEGTPAAAAAAASSSDHDTSPSPRDSSLSALASSHFPPSPDASTPKNALDSELGGAGVEADISESECWLDGREPQQKQQQQPQQQEQQQQHAEGCGASASIASNSAGIMSSW